MFKLLFSPSGRLNRKPFILTALIMCVVGIVMYSIVMLTIGAMPGMDPALAQDPAYAQQFSMQMIDYIMSIYTHPLSIVTMLVSFVIGIMTGIKRLHDLNKSGRWYLINLVPILGGIYYFIITVFQKGTIGDNRFGPDPLQNA